jgi:hypothetical protein
MKRKSKFKTGTLSLAHVLYQKLGNDWYAFAEMDGNCFMTKVEAEEAANAHENAKQISDDSRNFRSKRRAA